MPSTTDSFLTPGGQASNTYDPAAIEARWQAAWTQQRAFAAPPPQDERTPAYVFAGCPFTSGDAHIGHIRSYTISDAYARFLRARGNAVLFSLGFDSFGLPAELEAVRRGVSPQEWVARCVARMGEQSAAWATPATGSAASSPPSPTTTAGRSGCSWRCCSATSSTGTRRRSAGAIPARRCSPRCRSRTAPAGAATARCASGACRSGSCGSAPMCGTTSRVLSSCPAGARRRSARSAR